MASFGRGDPPHAARMPFNGLIFACAAALALYWSTTPVSEEGWEGRSLPRAAALLLAPSESAGRAAGVVDADAGARFRARRRR